VEQKIVKKRVHDSILNQQLIESKFFIIGSKLIRIKLGKDLKRIFSTIKISRATSKYSISFFKLTENKLNCSTNIKNFSLKHIFIRYLIEKIRKEEFVGLIKLKSFCLKLPEDTFEYYSLATENVEKRLKNLCLKNLEGFLITNSTNTIKLHTHENYSKNYTH
jgi:hypothetical protein